MDEVNVNVAKRHVGQVNGRFQRGSVVDLEVNMDLNLKYQLFWNSVAFLYQRDERSSD